MDAKLLKALSNASRINMIELLLLHPYCVKALAYKLNLSESAVSQHLKILREAGLVDGVCFGYYTHYQINREPLEELSKQLHDLSCVKGLGLARCSAAETIGCIKKPPTEGGNT